MSEHKRLIKMYDEALGYEPQSWKREHSGAKRILDMGYSPEDAIALYNELKAGKFWEAKHLSLTYIAQQLPAWVSSRTKPVTTDE
jgi:hypothetical protein